MAEEQKPVEVPAAEAPAAEAAAEAPAAVEAAAAEAAPAEAAVEAPAAEAAAEPAPEAPAAAEEPKKEAEPIEEGILEAKGSGFPKSLLYTKKFFWFPKEAVSPKDLAAYLKSEKASDAAHHVVSWAAETGKGLLFYGEKQGEKPHGVIHLADASEPTTEGATKFHLTTKGHKHVFKAPTAADRDNWVAQIKAKIAEAKELAASVTETETYKNTLASLKPAKKEPAPQIYFKLRCRKFLEMMRRSNELSAEVADEAQKRRRSVSPGIADEHAVFDQEMELDDGEAWDADGMDTEEPEAVSQFNQLLTEAVEYGQQLRIDYPSDENGGDKKMLDDIFSLVAYPDPKRSVHGHYLDPEGRVVVAEELNSAILVSLGKSSTAALERLYQQTEALVNELSEDGGAGAFINVRDIAFP